MRLRLLSESVELVCKDLALKVKLLHKENLLPYFDFFDLKQVKYTFRDGKTYIKTKPNQVENNLKQDNIKAKIYHLKYHYYLKKALYKLVGYFYN